MYGQQPQMQQQQPPMQGQQMYGQPMYGTQQPMQQMPPQQMGGQPPPRRSKWDAGPGGVQMAGVPGGESIPAPAPPPHWDPQTIAISQEFIARWNLDAFSQVELYKCTPVRLQKVTEQFQPPPQTTDVNQKFRAFMANAEGSIHETIALLKANMPDEDPNGYPQEMEVAQFCSNFGVEERVVQFLLSMPKKVQGYILRGFKNKG